MKADDANFLDLLKKMTQFTVPIYQRPYSWGISECQQLFNDIMEAGESGKVQEHFTGSIVYIDSRQGTISSEEPRLIIDGQQRVATLTLLLAALAKTLEENPGIEGDSVGEFSAKKIRSYYLLNPVEEEDSGKYHKLELSRKDRQTLFDIIDGNETPEASRSQQLIDNYEFFLGKLSDAATINTVCAGIKKLVVVDVNLTLGIDNPQKVFESMNSTGKKLSQTDLIRNFVLMDLPRPAQNRIFNTAWKPMEDLFEGETEDEFDSFVRRYLVMKTGSIPTKSAVYEAFRSYTLRERGTGSVENDTKEAVSDLYKYAKYYSAIAFGTEKDEDLRERFTELVALRATVSYPLILRCYDDWVSGTITKDMLLEIVGIVISYILRRAVCGIPTNSLDNTFAAVETNIKTADYLNSIEAKFLNLQSYQRFPDDEEFKRALVSFNLYDFHRKKYFLDKLENFGMKERTQTDGYTIEHIMPQNPNLSDEWKSELGNDWEQVHDKYLNTLGNLTLTGYNSEYSDRPFQEKRDMKNYGFRDSPIRLSAGLGQLDHWNAEEIEKRADMLANKAVKVWPMPVLSDDVLESYAAATATKRRHV